MAGQKAETGTVDKYQKAIDNHKRMGIETYTLTCETGESCLIRQPNVIETSKILPLMNGMGFDDKGNQKEPDMVGAGMKIIDMCWIAGDDQIRKDENLKAEVALAAVTLIRIKIADVKKN